MSIYYAQADLDEMKNQALAIYLYASDVREDVLANDLRDQLRNRGPYSNTRIEEATDVKISVWKGLTSRHIAVAPVGAKYISDLEPIGDFEDLLKLWGFTLRHVQHGAGYKAFVTI